MLNSEMRREKEGKKKKKERKRGTNPAPVNTKRDAMQ
jgi:hypothetical protein